MKTSICLKDEEFQKFKQFCEETERSLSGLFRLGARKILEEEKNGN